MPKRVTPEQKQEILRLLARGEDRETIAAMVGVTPGQVSAISAHVRMGTYQLPDEADNGPAKPEEPGERTRNVLQQIRDLATPTAAPSSIAPIYLGTDAETNEEVYWSPGPDNGSANPHVLVLGESGFGKTYTICCLLAELARQRALSVVFDYGQGFAAESLPPEFIEAARPVYLRASRAGININPLQIFPSDVHGPLNVAQRVADTFARVYPKIGVQQHAVLRQAVLDVMTDAGIVAEEPESWERDLPAFGEVQRKLLAQARQSRDPQSRVAATVASHISTLFVFNTFRPSGQALAWTDMMASDMPVYVLELRGLEHSLERAVTEFLLCY
jgi:hypothetical protein